MMVLYLNWCGRVVRVYAGKTTTDIVFSGRRSLSVYLSRIDVGPHFFFRVCVCVWPLSKGDVMMSSPTLKHVDGVSPIGPLTGAERPKYFFQNGGGGGSGSVLTWLYLDQRWHADTSRKASSLDKVQEGTHPLRENSTRAV